jgi:hypothetical protein
VKAWEKINPGDLIDIGTRAIFSTFFADNQTVNGKTWEQNVAGFVIVVARIDAKPNLDVTSFLYVITPRKVGWIREFQHSIDNIIQSPISDVI